MKLPIAAEFSDHAFGYGTLGEPRTKFKKVAIRDWWREMWPWITFDAAWVTVGLVLFRRHR